MAARKRSSGTVIPSSLGTVTTRAPRRAVRLVHVHHGREVQVLVDDLVAPPGRGRSRTGSPTGRSETFWCITTEPGGGADDAADRVADGDGQLPPALGPGAHAARGPRAACTRPAAPRRRAAWRPASGSPGRSCSRGWGTRTASEEALSPAARRRSCGLGGGRRRLRRGAAATRLRTRAGPRAGSGRCGSRASAPPSPACPGATSRPPAAPASGPRSITWSALLIDVEVVLDHDHRVAGLHQPAQHVQQLRARRRSAGRWWARRGCRGCGRSRAGASSRASFTRCASPPERVAALWPRRM